MAPYDTPTAAQRLAFGGGVVQLLTLMLQLTSGPAAALQLISGLAALYCATGHDTARRYGALLLMVYGSLLLGHLQAGPATLLHLMTLHDARAVVLGLLIATVPVRRRAVALS